MTDNRLKKVKRPEPAKTVTEGQVRMAIASSNLTPLEFMIAVIRNDHLPIPMRMEAARQAAPYLHRKMPTEVETKDTTEIKFDSEMLKNLSRNELESLKAILEKTGAEVLLNRPH